MNNKKDLMNELLDRYEQLEPVQECKSSKQILELYIRKLEIKLKELL